MRGDGDLGLFDYTLAQIARVVLKSGAVEASLNVRAPVKHWSRGITYPRSRLLRAKVYANVKSFLFGIQEYSGRCSRNNHG